MEDVQARKDGEKSGSTEKCAAAFAGANILRIQLKAISDEKEDDGMQANFSFGEREKECLKTNPSLSPNNQSQLSLPSSGDDNRGIPALCYSDARERLPQGDDVLDQMELEGGGLAQPSW
ncbi:hypothetical protein SO802_001741 [Lithocarpus litseifolius]|uniref:Uncharacterized protein n=1 Tax=Lithocarpus litseifolius TaxID=425828 RepID=A0AAW2DXZ8_9ROSI